MPKHQPAELTDARRRRCSAVGINTSLHNRPCSTTGHDGGRIVFAGTPTDLVAARATLTGKHLAAYVGA